jgi:hypothetical protein
MIKFKTFLEQSIDEDAELNARQATETERLRDQQKRQKETLKRRHDAQDTQAKQERERESQQ